MSDTDEIFGHAGRDPRLPDPPVDLAALVARAASAERMLAELEEWAASVDAVLGNLCWGRHDAQRVRKPLSKIRNDRRDRERAALAATERELAALTPSAAPSPASAG